MPPENEEKALELYHRGVELLDRRELEAAVESFKQSLSISVHFKSLERLGVCYRALGVSDLALGCLRQAFELNRASSKTAVLFAEELLAHAQIKEAREILADVLVKNSTYEPARRLLESLEAE
jgi:tetratricopeptide (TPR) repeat protein